MRYKLILLFLCLSGILMAQEPAGTYVFAERDGQELNLDVYYPAADAKTTLDGIEKPTILYVFGGGFITGRRDDPFMSPWFSRLLSEGYKIVSVDYRLGLKDQDVSFKLFTLAESARKVKRAVDMGVEDVFSAIRFIADNREALGIDPDNIVISGSSAGAMISLSAELETCSPTSRTAILPEGFRFKGVMSFAGAIMTDSGLPSYATEPAPQLLLHGDKDDAVPYNKTVFGRLGAYGSSALVKEVFAKNGYVYNICRYPGHNHDIAGSMFETWPEQKRFLETNVMRGQKRIVDASIVDPELPVWNNITLDYIYNEKH
ncbi:MAG: alpha/beta hydrolase [Bacteroidales bacterium]|nr:alpha/beta hydrolase [Bacteroidales bacterium]